MIEASDVWHSLLMGIFAAVAATGATVAIERLGGIVGGVISSMPTTIVPTAVGLALAVSTDSVKEAMLAVPTGMLINVAVLFSWRQLPPYLPVSFSSNQRLGMMIGASLGIWFLAVVLLVFVVRNTLGVSGEMLGWSCAAVTVIFGWAAVLLQPLPAPKGANKVSIQTLLVRGLLAGAAIFSAGMIAKVNSYAAGFASMFPAIFTTTMVSMWLSQGSTVGTGAAGPMMLGSQSVSAFGLMFAYLLPSGGITLTTLASWLFGILCFSVPNALILRWLSAKQAAANEDAQADTTKPDPTSESSGGDQDDSTTVSLDQIDPQPK